MGNKEKMLEYRERLDKTLASHDFTDGESIKSRVRNQLLRSSSSEIQGYVENLVEKKAKELSNFLNMLRSVRNDKLMPKTNGMVHGDWKLKQDNDEYRVMYREGPQGTPFHTLLVEGYVDGPVDVCLCLSLEVSLFNKWWPQFSFPSFKIMAANCLQRVRIDEQICLVRMKVPWPLSAREAILHYYELDFFEDDLIIVILDSVSDIEGIERHTHGFTKDGIPEAKDIKRVDVVGGFILQKLTSNRSFFRTMATMDIKMDFVPPSLINFMSRQLIGSGFKFYQKTVASIAKGDEDFGKALKDPIYVRIREGLYHENRLKKAPEQEVLESEKSTEICPEEPTTETVVNNATDKDQISLADHFVTLSPQADESCIDQKSLNEIEEEVMEQKTNLEEDEKALDHSSMNQNVEQCHASQDRSSNEIEEEVIEQATNVVEDGKVVDHSSMNHNVEQWHVSRDKKVFIRPQVQHALNILNNVISLVRGGGLGIQTWSGFDSTTQQPVYLENVTMDACSSSSRDGLDGGVCLEAPRTDTTDKAPDGAENSSNGHPFSTDAPDSPKREVKHSVSVVPTSVLEQHSLTSEEKNTPSLKTAEGDASDRSQNGAVENLSEAQVLSKMSKDNEEVSVKVNGIHEMDANVNGGDQKFKQKKKHRPVEVLKSTTEYTKEAVTNEKHRGPVELVKSTTEYTNKDVTNEKNMFDGFNRFLEVVEDVLYVFIIFQAEDTN